VLLLSFFKGGTQRAALQPRSHPTYNNTERDIRCNAPSRYHFLLIEEEKMDPVYARWVARFYMTTPAVGLVLYALPHLPVQARKVILSYTRTRQRVSTSTRFAKMHTHELPRQYSFIIGDNPKSQYTTMTLKELIIGVEAHIHDQVILAFLSTCVRSAPYQDYSSVLKTREDTIAKEIAAGLMPAYNETLNFEAILDFDPTSRNKRLAPNLPLNPTVHAQLHNAFRSARSSLQGAILYPQTSDKTIGEHAQQLCARILDAGDSQLVSMRTIQSLSDVERMYHRTGARCEGVVEMRCAWKYNDLKPRVYYAQGPDCYFASRYVQEVFNVILDQFEVVHRHNRFERPARPFEDIQDRLAMYDYSSFTSSLESIKDFTRSMAQFFKGVQVICVDTWSGPVLKDLGDMLLEYTEVCNETSLFDLSTLFLLDEELVVQHTCGMLGVPGNISSCTLLHGLHLVVILGDMYLGRCVGDDALAIVRGGSDAEVWAVFVDQVNNLGAIAEEKFEYWDYEDDPDTTGGAYCKRPIARMSNSIIQDKALIWPGIHDLIPLRDAYHTSIPCTELQIRKKFIAQWSRLLTRTEIQVDNLSEAARDLLHCFQVWAYRTLGLRGGGQVQCSDTYSQIKLVCPKLLKHDELNRGWVQITLDYMRRDGQVVTLPSWAGLDETCCYTEGEVFHSKSTRLLSLMERLGYLEREIQREEYDLTSLTSPAFLSRLITLQYPFLYRYHVLADCPSWCNNVNSLELMSPHARLSVV